MIEILEADGQLLLIYESEQGPLRWVFDEFQKAGQVTLRRVFTFKAKDLNDDPDLIDWNEWGSLTFTLGIENDDYYRIHRDILGLKYDLLLTKQMEIRKEIFIAERKISIFRKIDKLVDEPIIVGGDVDGSIPLSEFQDLLRNFPTSTELDYYSNAKISRILKDYFETMADEQRKLETYLSRKKTICPISKIMYIKSYEIQKFEYVRNELKAMLEEAETYDEKSWQKLVAEFLLLIFPKYIAVLENLNIKDFYSDPSTVKQRYIDQALVDANGMIDIIEIKKPFANCLLSRGKYRDNYTPRTELAGSVMQAEKYLFHLTKWGCAGEKQILEKRKSELPEGFEIKITNPKAMIILGRDSDFDNEQRFDFEIIRRKYANVIDIMTYDDLLRRLDNIIIMINRNIL